MSLSNAELIKKVGQFPDLNLTLFNENKESYRAGELRTLIHTKRGVTLRWAMDKPLDNITPLTHAVLHRGPKVWNVLSIRPLASDSLGTELEIKYDY